MREDAPATVSGGPVHNMHLQGPVDGPMLISFWSVLNELHKQITVMGWFTWLYKHWLLPYIKFVLFLLLEKIQVRKRTMQTTHWVGSFIYQLYVVRKRSLETPETVSNPSPNHKRRRSSPMAQAIRPFPPSMPYGINMGPALPPHPQSYQFQPPAPLSYDAHTHVNRCLCMALIHRCNQCSRSNHMLNTPVRRLRRLLHTIIPSTCSRSTLQHTIKPMSALYEESQSPSNHFRGHLKKTNFY